MLELFAHLGTLALVAQIVRLEQAAAIVPVELVSLALAEHVCVFAFRCNFLGLTMPGQQVLSDQVSFFGYIDFCELRLQESQAVSFRELLGL